MPSALRAQKGLRRFWRWLPALGWMSIIFTASGGGMAHGQTSRYFYPFFRALFPGIAEETIALLHFLFRKGGHLLEYGILAALLWFALKGWCAGWGRARLAWLIAVLYAASDEFHQMWVPSRQGAVGDVLIDAVGAALGLGVVILAARRLFPALR